MTPPAIPKMLSLSCDAIATAVGVEEALDYLNKWGVLGKELAQLLSQRNGFYAFESALLVRPFQHERFPLGLVQWNDSELWKGKYVENLDDMLFFAEDVFGGQFCIGREEICIFDPETGALEAKYDTLDAWASDLVADYKFRTGYPLAHTWQIQNAPLQPGTRLLPKVPFVCGGKYDVDNLYAIDDAQGMLFRASLANQIRDLPDGAQIVLDIPSNE